MPILRSRFAFLALLASAATVSTAWASTASGTLDALTLGVAQSEEAHHLSGQSSEILTAALHQTARRLLPLGNNSEYGGDISFDLKCDPEKPTYVTVKFWGGDSDSSQGRLLLFANGKQLGVRHIGDVDILDIASDQPRFPGRFYYKTLPLPRELTRGKNTVHLEIRGLGMIWAYGTTWDKFQRPMTEPSRGIYAVYTHTDPCFNPPTSDVQGNAPVDPPARTEPGPEVLDKLKSRVDGEVKQLMTARSLNQMEIQFLARAYHVRWTTGYHNPAAVQTLVNALDHIYAQYRADPHLAASDPATPNPDWFGLGPSGDAIWLLNAELKPFLDQPIPAAKGLSRRHAWSEMLVATRDWHRQHRRLYTNQSMINDLYGIYLPNRALEIIDPEKAMPEEQIRHYLYQSIGLEPWLGSDAKNGPDKLLGDHYMELTEKGLTRELGYVGAYGEVLDWVTSIYNATRPAPGETEDPQPGDPRIKDQLLKIAKARSYFREPLLDATGHREMVLESVVGWRDNHYPGYVTYGQRASWDAGPLDLAAATMDPAQIGFGQQMLADNQFFAAIDESLQNHSFRVTAGLLQTPDSYEAVKNAPPSAARLPMSGADFVFSDEEDGVVAIKHGSDILYASLYWRARSAINFLARVHYLTPTMERDATVWEDAKYDDSGFKFTIDDRVIEPYTRRFEQDRGDVEQAFQGEVLPIAKVPPDVKYKPGDENIYAGKGTFYQLRYGNYLIAMNMTTDRHFAIAAPDDVHTARDLEAGKSVSLESPLQVGPRSTLVLYLGE